MQFKAGEIVRMANGLECEIESFEGYDSLGREIYIVVTDNITITTDGRPVNRYKTVVVPMLLLTGIAY
jgi:hypothetical protein